MPPRIPKRIIQVWCPPAGKGHELSTLQRAAVHNVKLLNPDFEYMFFDNKKVEQFLRNEFPEYRETIESFRFPIQKFDFLRYLAIYRYGGFYFDLDVFLASGLSALLDFDCVFSFEELNRSRFLRQRYGMDWDVGNYAFGAVPGHPFLKAVIENCVRAQKDPGWVEPMMQGIPRPLYPEFLILNTTGPTAVSRTLAENPSLAETITVLFPDDVCDPRSRHHFGDFGIHLMSGSWRNHYGWVMRRLVWIWRVWTWRKLMKDSRKLGKTRQLVTSSRPSGGKEAQVYAKS